MIYSALDEWADLEWGVAPSELQYPTFFCFFGGIAFTDPSFGFRGVCFILAMIQKIPR